MGVAKKTGVEGLNSQSSAGLVHSSRECTAIRDACDAWRKLSQLSGQIMGGLEEISSKRLACELAQIEGGPWAQWGRGREKKRR
jgi:hypothetical protein